MKQRIDWDRFWDKCRRDPNVPYIHHRIAISIQKLVEAEMKKQFKPNKMIIKVFKELEQAKNACKNSGIKYKEAELREKMKQKNKMKCKVPNARKGKGCYGMFSICSYGLCRVFVKNSIDPKYKWCSYHKEHGARYHTGKKIGMRV